MSMTTWDFEWTSDFYSENSYLFYALGLTPLSDDGLYCQLENPSRCSENPFNNIARVVRGGGIHTHKKNNPTSNDYESIWDELTEKQKGWVIGKRSHVGERTRGYENSRHAFRLVMDNTETLDGMKACLRILAID